MILCFKWPLNFSLPRQKHHCTSLLWVSDVKGPKKMFPDLPFGNADYDKVEARKSQLDSFLKVGISFRTSAIKGLYVVV